MRQAAAPGSAYDGRVRRYGGGWRACDYRARSSFLQRQAAVLYAMSGVEPCVLLDVGCGPGLLSAPLAARHRIVGLDLSVEMLKRARGHAVPVRADALRLPFRDASFGVVLAIEVLQHFSEPGPMLGDLARVLRPGGILLVSSLHPASLFHRGWKRFFGGYHGLTLHDPRKVRSEAGRLGLRTRSMRLLGFPFPFTWSGRLHDGPSERLASAWLLEITRT